MRPVVRWLRESCSYRVRIYVDDLRIDPSRFGVMENLMNAARARKTITSLLERICLTRNMEKGCWQGSRQIEHLGMLLDTSELGVYIQDHKVRRVHDMALRMLRRSHLNKRLIYFSFILRFCGVCVALTLGFLLERFYTRELYFDLSGATA